MTQHHDTDSDRTYWLVVTVDGAHYDTLDESIHRIIDCDSKDERDHIYYGLRVASEASPRSIYFFRWPEERDRMSDDIEAKVAEQIES